MENNQWTYLQFRKSAGYSVYIRLQKAELHAKYLHLFEEMGFQEINQCEVRKIQLHKPQTKLLTIQLATARIGQEIQGTNLLDQYGSESLSIQYQTPIYLYRKVGMMMMPRHKSLWELALTNELNFNEQLIGVRIILARFLAQALADQGVVSYWGTLKDGTLITMKQDQSFGEAVFIDWDKKLIFCNGQELKFNSQIKLLRKDKAFAEAPLMKREELISYMTVSTCLLSFHGITPAMKRSVLEMSAYMTGSYSISDSHFNL